jgi:hypothetical protein
MNIRPTALPHRQGHFWTALAAVALASLTAALAFFNAAGWLDRQLPLLAALAVITEVIAFTMAVSAELAWGRSTHWLVRIARVACCLLILAGCEAFNAAGSHEAWRQTVAKRAETLTAPQRNAITAQEARLTLAITDAQARIDAVPLPDLSGGPQNDAQAIAAWQALTASDRTVKSENEAALRSLDRTVEEPEAPFSESVVWAFLTFLGFTKVSGLWAIGVAVFRREDEAPAGNAEETNIVSFPTGEARKQAARALRDAGHSFGEIERRIGVRKGTAHRWCK